MTPTISPQPISSAMEIWEGIVQSPQIVDYFRGVFKKAGIKIEETGEEFTAIHNGDTILFQPGIDPEVDFQLLLTLQNISNLVEHAQDGEIDEVESWRIITTVFTPMTTATLQNPVVASAWVRKILGVEDLIHAHLMDPAGSAAVTHTLAYTAGQWLVIPGLHGVPQRTYHMTPYQALEFQKRVSAAIAENSFAGWWQFGDWYREWRLSVSVT
jgi:hypothetical protein